MSAPLLPGTLKPRELVALPLYVVLVLLWTLAVFFGFVADYIAGKGHSKQLTGV